MILRKFEDLLTKLTFSRFPFTILVVVTHNERLSNHATVFALNQFVFCFNVVIEFCFWNNFVATLWTLDKMTQAISFV